MRRYLSLKSHEGSVEPPGESYSNHLTIILFAGPQGHERVGFPEPRILASLLSSRRLVGGHGFRRPRKTSQNLSETLDFGGTPSKTQAPMIGRGARGSKFWDPPLETHTVTRMYHFSLF